MCPQGYTYSKTQGRFVKKKTEQAFDYDAINKKCAALLVSFFRWYPDYYLDLIRADSADHKLELLQRVILRIFARYRITHITGCRGGTKTYLMNASKQMDGTFFPGEKMGYVAPAQKQSASLGSDAYKELERDYPILTSLWKIKNDRDDKFRIVTDYGSEFTMYIPRGSNKHQIGVEEMGQEAPEPFDMKNFKTTVNPTLRLKRTVNQVEDKVHINFKRSVITNASERQNLTFTTYRQGALEAMLKGEKYAGYCMDFTWKSVLLCNIRDIEYFEQQFKELLPEERERELCAHYTGISENPMIPDETLSRSRKLLCTELEHCGDPNAIYVVCYDVADEDGKNNAKCGLFVWKLTEFTNISKRDKYKAQAVYVDSFPPPKTYFEHAVNLKQIWKRYCMDGGQTTYLVIDCQGGHGKSIVEELMKPTTDGSRPLCCMDNYHQELEQPNALRVIYPMKAGTRGTTDPDGDMIDYAQNEHEQGNVEYLISNIHKGLQQYKDNHGIKDDFSDRQIVRPYQKTEELIMQIKNLKKVASGTTVKEQRKSTRIPRDIWSSGKYGLRIKQKLEAELVEQHNKAGSSYASEIERFKNGQIGVIPQGNSQRSRLLGLRNIRK